MKYTALHDPLSIDCIRDGGAYQLPAIPFVQTNLFLKVGRLNEVFIKVPSERGLDDFRKFVKLGKSSPEDVRSLADAEQFGSVELTLERFRDLKEIFAANTEAGHYLLVHALQYKRLQNQNAIGIPQARFGILGSARLGFFQSFQPALFQQRVHGTTLWNMFDFKVLRVRSQWRQFLPAISSQLAQLFHSELATHIDWNIKNFVWAESEEQLFYVDVKPSLFVAKNSNEQNRKGILDYFIHD